ncbi:MAG: hydroxymethylbilane synthase [Bacteroidetes bacterium]|nr:MAG: hydroxymethylbilane synthase [Bacteroidota bacterium]
MHIKIGTRGSKLALWQANFVKEKLEKQGFSAEITIIETKGDKILDVSLSKIGSKGVFTQELEDKLFSDEIDIAVHSAKDVQSDLPEGLELMAFMEREMANDVVISFDKNFKLENNSTLIVGTSSTRRVAFLKSYYPDIQIVDMRGNLQTRFEKLKNGTCHAMLLAYAGVHRMGYQEYIVSHLPLDVFVPPVGQGSVAIEAKRTLDENKKMQIKNVLNHSKTEKCLLTERTFLKTMQGGCSVPSFAYCQENQNLLTIFGGIISLDGMQKISFSVSGTEPQLLGNELAQKVLSHGGKEILAEIKRNK